MNRVKVEKSIRLFIEMIIGGGFVMIVKGFLEIVIGKSFFR